MSPKKTACADTFSQAVSKEETILTHSIKISKGLRILFPYLLLIPAGALLAVFKLYPIFSTLANSFLDDGQFSLSMYENVLSDPNVWKSLGVTLKFILITIPLQVVVSFCLGLLVSTTYKGVSFFRTIFFSTFAISTAISVLVWEKIFNYNSGLFNSILGVFGIELQGFLVSSDQALFCIIVMTTWKGCGYWMVFFLSGLKNIDGSLYESAKIDGANLWKTITRITLPLMRRVILFVCVANTTANVLLFAPVQMSTQGGPQGSTNLLMYEAYKSAFKYANPGRASALIMILVIIIGMVCFVQFKFLNKSEE